MDELRKRVSEGGVSFEEIAEAMETATSKGGQFYNGMEEASKTLTGQLSTLKDNVNSLLGEMTQGLTDTLSNKLVPGAIDAVNQMTQAFESGGFEGLAQTGVQIVGNIISGIASQIPSVAAKGYEILNNLATGFAQGVPEFLPKILEFVQGIGKKIAEYAPVLIQKGFEILQKIAEGIVSAIPILIEKVPTIITTFANIINDNFPIILAKGAQIIGQLALGLIQAIPTLIANIPKIVEAIGSAVLAFQWINLGKTIIQLLGNGILGMVGFAKNAGTSVLNAIKGSIQNLPSTLASIGKSAMNGLGNAIRGAIGTIRSAASSIGNSLVSSLKSIPSKMLSIGRNIVQGLWNGISDMTGWIIDKIGGFADSVVSSIKDFFGIHSPSTLMRDEVGQWLAKGIGVGFEENMPTKQMTKSIKNAISDMQNAALKVTSEIPMTSKIASKAVTNNYTDFVIDYKEIEKAQLSAMNKANERPVILNNRQINRARKNGGLVTT